MNTLADSKNFGGQWIGNLRAENGGEYIDDTALHSGKWFAFLVIEDAVLTSIVQPMIANTAAILTPFVWDAGTVIYGYTESIELASGTVLAVQF